VAEHMEMEEIPGGDEETDRLVFQDSEERSVTVDKWALRCLLLQHASR
jgi:hypothetical protein